MDTQEDEDFVSKTVNFFRSCNESKWLNYVVIPTILTFVISHFTVLVILFLNTWLPDFKAIPHFNNYLQSGGILTTSISILVTSCIGYYFSPLKPSSNKPNLFKIVVLIVTIFVILSAGFTYILILNIYDNLVTVSTKISSYVTLAYSLIALVAFNVWNFTADGAKSYLNQEESEREGLHK